MFQPPSAMWQRAARPAASREFGCRDRLLKRTGLIRPGEVGQPVFRVEFSLSLLAMSNTTSFGYSIPAARKISPLRQRMIDDITVRDFAPKTP